MRFSILCDIVYVTQKLGGNTRAKFIIKELWHGNICPQSDSINNFLENKEIME